jgi:hypothetical protein
MVVIWTNIVLIGVTEGARARSFNMHANAALAIRARHENRIRRFEANTIRSESAIQLNFIHGPLCLIRRGRERVRMALFVRTRFERRDTFGVHLLFVVRAVGQGRSDDLFRVYGDGRIQQ